MSPAFATLALFAEIDWSRSVAPSLLAAALLAAVLGAVNPGGGELPIRARNATGGPVKPATFRDYVLVTLFFAIGIACMFVGLWFMKR